MIITYNIFYHNIFHKFICIIYFITNRIINFIDHLLYKCYLQYFIGLYAQNRDRIDGLTEELNKIIADKELSEIFFKILKDTSLFYYPKAKAAAAAAPKPAEAEEAP